MGLMTSISMMTRLETAQTNFLMQKRSFQSSIKMKKKVLRYKYPQQSQRRKTEPNKNKWNNTTS
jgi:hypothetical protein